MNTEDAPDVTTVRSSLLTEASGDTTIAEGEVSWLDPLLHVHGRDGLLGGGNQIERLRVISALNLIEIFAEVRKLASLLHNCLLHEVGRLNVSVPTLVQLRKTEVDQSLVEHDTEALKIVAAMASDARAALHLEDAEALHDLVMMKFSKSVAINNNVAVWLTESAHNLVKVLILRDDDLIADDVSNLSEESFSLPSDVLGDLLLSLDSLIKLLRLLLFSADVSLLVGLLFSGDGLGNVTLLLAKSIESVLG